jgi:hypothetical protein
MPSKEIVGPHWSLLSASSFFFLIFFIAVLVLELRASCLLGFARQTLYHLSHSTSLTLCFLTSDVVTYSDMHSCHEVSSPLQAKAMRPQILDMDTNFQNLFTSQVMCIRYFVIVSKS